ncbi:O-antigen polymerase [Acinetobacter ursingii]|uniref:O-antigen polymerase n=4 Tax=Acinetobacter ursingii TaxID=108980 RepID=UPI0012509ADD|nr:O-antigen polymerase [Acinetobacter ursingii]
MSYIKAFILNPFFYYIFSFFIALSLYSLNWSDLYPELSFTLVIFLISTMVFSIFIGGFYNVILKKRYNNRQDLSFLKLNNKNVFFISFFMVFLISLEFLYNKGIPFLQILSGYDYNYFDFGIPVLHVIILPYITLLGFTFSYRYILFNRKIYLIPIFISYLFPILIINRSTVMMLVFGSLFMYLYYRFSIKKVIYSIVILFCLLFSFGVAGDYRMKSLGYDNENGILLLGQANSNFENSLAPKQFFWTYLYASSPLANLQVSQNSYFYNNNGYYDFLLNNIIIDAVSKRIRDDNYSDIKLIDESLNVRTIYGDAMSQLKFVGCFLLFSYYTFFIIFFTLLVSRKFLPVMQAILCVLSLFVLFTNLLYLSGFVLMFWLLGVISRIKVKYTFI